MKRDPRLPEWLPDCWTPVERDNEIVGYYYCPYIPVLDNKETKE